MARVGPFAAACGSELRADKGASEDAAWSIQADYTDTCSCAPTCPCLFGSAPTMGFCEGLTLIEIENCSVIEVSKLLAVTETVFVPGVAQLNETVSLKPPIFVIPVCPVACHS